MKSHQYATLFALIIGAGFAHADTVNGRPQGAPSDTLPSPSMNPASTPSATGNQDQDGTTRDQVIADDLIVQGSTCSGFDCVNNESFGFDTIRLKENNLRVKFDDTSVGAFPANDWQLTANDSSSGGANKFSIEDITAARVPFTVMAGAATDSIFVDATGRVGFRTSSPVLDLHVSTGNTPALRLDQTANGGFTPQTWDVAGNEANFFVRDVTSGSRLPFRIRPGAPTSSIDIANDGDIGFGTAAPQSRADFFAPATVGAPISALRVTNPQYGTSGATENVEAEVRFEVDSDGNVTARGAITQLSSRWSKENLSPVDGRSILERLAGLPIQTWNYIGQDQRDQHLGPVAEEFHAAFGLGNNNRRIALSDMAGVALAAVQELNAKLQQRDAQIAAQEQRLRALEEQIARLQKP